MSKKKKILWIDDEVWYLEGYLAYFSDHPKIEIQVISTIDSAVFKLQNDKFDLIISDFFIEDFQNEEHYLIKLRNGDFDLENDNPKISEIPIIIFSLAGDYIIGKEMGNLFRTVSCMNKAETMTHDIELEIKRILSIA